MYANTRSYTVGHNKIMQTLKKRYLIVTFSEFIRILRIWA